VLWQLVKSLRLARNIIREFSPGVVVGVGGYASGPVLWQAGRMGIPTLIQEQNSYAGVTNRLLARRAKVICVAYEGMEKYFPAAKIIKTGNPVRQNFERLDQLREEAVQYFGIPGNDPVVLVLGGSQGAGTINSCLGGDRERIKDSGCHWIWQTGKNYYPQLSREEWIRTGNNVILKDFIERMDYAFAAADVIISRAGAGTISELCLVGKPVILVPSPNVAEDHQTRNALALASKGAAVLVKDSEAGERLIEEALKLVKDTERRNKLSENISLLADRNADVRIAREVLKLIEQ
jgi:UDP-N-acetylglucosamine--N-acetylmuramyl-(pentapeptide) pyrophosphoryl-undecaprenol N-acetylglucosamine transferase